MDLQEQLPFDPDEDTKAETEKKMKEEAEKLQTSAGTER